jgi:hypothetical protein
MGRVQDVDVQKLKRFCFILHQALANQPYAPADASRECTARSPLLAAWHADPSRNQESSSLKHSARLLGEVLNRPCVTLRPYHGGPLIFPNAGVHVFCTPEAVCWRLTIAINRHMC